MVLSDLPPFPRHPAYPYRNNPPAQQEGQIPTGAFPKVSKSNLAGSSLADDNFSNNEFSHEDSSNGDFPNQNINQNTATNNLSRLANRFNAPRSSRSHSSPFSNSEEYDDPLDPFEQPRPRHNASSVFPGSGDLPSFVIAADTPNSSTTSRSRKMLYWGIGIVAGILFIFGIIWASVAGVNYLRTNSARNSYSAALKAYTTAQDTWLSERKKAQDLLESTKDQVAPNTPYFAVEKMVDWKLPDIPQEGNSLQSINSAIDNVNASLVVITSKIDELVKEMVELRIAHNRWVKSDQAKPTPPSSSQNTPSNNSSASPLPSARSPRKARPDYRPRREDIPRPQQAAPTPPPSDHASRNPRSSSRLTPVTPTPAKPAKPENPTKPGESSHKDPSKEVKNKDTKEKSPR